MLPSNENFSWNCQEKHTKGKVTAIERDGCIDRLRHAWRKLHDFARFPRKTIYRLEHARAKSTHLDSITYKPLEMRRL